MSRQGQSSILGSVAIQRYGASVGRQILQIESRAGTAAALSAGDFMLERLDRTKGDSVRISNQEIVSLVIAAITDEADGLYELAKSVQPSLAVAHAHALNGALHLLVNLLSEMDDEKGRNAGQVEGIGLLAVRAA